MPRPKKWRKVCCLPETNKFGPLNGNANEDKFVVISIDEYEAIRLIDLEGMKQEECAMQMKIARTTVQGIYDKARKKIADSLINGKVLMIEGGDYMLCDGRGLGCNRRRCGNDTQENK